MKFYGYDLPSPKKKIKFSDLENLCDKGECESCPFDSGSEALKDFNFRFCLPPYIFSKIKGESIEERSWIIKYPEEYNEFKVNLLKEYYNYKETFQEEFDV